MIGRRECEKRTITNALEHKFLRGVIGNLLQELRAVSKLDHPPQTAQALIMMYALTNTLIL